MSWQVVLWRWQFLVSSCCSNYVKNACMDLSHEKAYSVMDSVANLLDFWGLILQKSASDPDNLLLEFVRVFPEFVWFGSEFLKFSIRSRQNFRNHLDFSEINLAPLVIKCLRPSMNYVKCKFLIGLKSADFWGIWKFFYENDSSVLAFIVWQLQTVAYTDLSNEKA